MADVETFNALRSRLKTQRLLQRFETIAQTGAVGKVPAQGVAYIEFGKFHPAAPQTARLAGEPHGLPGLLCKNGLKPVLFGNRVVQINFCWHRLAQVILTEKGSENFSVVGRLAKSREEQPVAEVAAIANERDAHASHAAFLHQRNDVGVFCCSAHRLAFLNLTQHRNPVAVARGRFVIERRRRRIHAFRGFLHHGLAFAIQKKGNMAHVLGIGLGVDVTDAGRGAAFDLVQQAGA